MRLEAFTDTYNWVQNYDGNMKVGINKFADWTAEEKKMLTGLRATPTLSFQEGVEEDYDEFHPRPSKGIDWDERGHVAAPKAQGKCGSCWAFSGTAAIESAYSIQVQERGEAVQTFSEQQMVDCSAEEFDNHGCQGGWFTGAYTWAEQYEVCYESEYTYHSGTDSERGECRQSECTHRHIDGFHVTQPGSQRDLEKALMHQPIAVAVHAEQANWYNYEGGIMDPKDCVDHSVNHGVLLVGMGVERDEEGNERGFWRIKNSWGPDWGENGFIRIHRDLHNFKYSPGTCQITLTESYYPFFRHHHE